MGENKVNASYFQINDTIFHWLVRLLRVFLNKGQVHNEIHHKTSAIPQTFPYNSELR